MDVFYSREHTSCFNYKKEADSTFNIVEFKKNDNFKEKNTRKNVIILILSGKVIVSCNEFRERIIRENELALLPVGCTFYGKTLEDSRIVSCAFYQEINLCNRYSLKMLTHFCNDIKNDFYVLSSTLRIRQFLDLLVLYLEDGINCSHFHSQKKDELFLLIRAYYSKEDQARLFYPIIGKDIDFKAFVLENATTVNNLNDLAKRLNCSLSSFKRQFVKHFDISPYQWIQGQKSSRIYQDVKFTEKPFQEIAMEYGFSSQAHFCKFCKTQFGYTPKQIRTDKAV